MKIKAEIEIDVDHLVSRFLKAVEEAIDSELKAKKLELFHKAKDAAEKRLKEIC